MRICKCKNNHMKKICVCAKGVARRKAPVRRDSSDIETINTLQNIFTFFLQMSRKNATAKQASKDEEMGVSGAAAAGAGSGAKMVPRKRGLEKGMHPFSCRVFFMYYPYIDECIFPTRDGFGWVFRNIEWF